MIVFVTDGVTVIAVSVATPNFKMLCCGGEKDSARDLKSAQNTPSRQPMHPPYPQPGQQQPGQLPQQTGMMGPTGLLQQQTRFQPPMSQINNYPKDDFRKVRHAWN